MTGGWFTADDLLTIPQHHYPILTLSDNLQSFVSWAIKARTNGAYNHLMWYHRPGWFASQEMSGFKEVPLRDFTTCHSMKFWWSPRWTMKDRVLIQREIKACLRLPWWRRRYDFLQILGKLLPGNAEFCNMPRTRICSDFAEWLKMSDPSYDLYHPAPAEVNRWLKARPERYQCYGRYKSD